MSYTSLIGGRYLRSPKKSSISAIGMIAVGGIALGVAALLVVISIASGFEDEFTEKVLGVNAHVLVMKYGIDFTEYRDVIAQLEAMPEVRGVAPFVIQEMMISKDDKTAGVLLKGIDPERIGDVLDLPRHITQGGLEGIRQPGTQPAVSQRRIPPPGSLLDRVDVALEDSDAGVPALVPAEPVEVVSATPRPSPDESQPPGIVLGATLAENLAAVVGDTVQITTPDIGLDVLGWNPGESSTRTVSFRVIGIFYAGFLEYDTKLAYVDYFQAQRFFNHGDTVTGVEMTLYDTALARPLAKRIKAMLGGAPFHTIDWEMLNEQLFRALRMQKVVLTVVLALIVGVAAFNIIATLVMMVFEKRKEIAILKSMGATHGGIMTIFLYLGMVVGLMGIAIGLGIGFGVCSLLIEVGWPLDPKVYLIDHLPVRLEALDFIVTAIVALLICLFATIWPSLSAARLRPVDGLRQD